MGFEEKTLDLFSLLMAHIGGSSLAVAVVPRPPTPAMTHASFVDVADKKRKKAQESKGTKGAEEGEVTHSSHQPLAKEPRTSRGQ